MDIKDKDFAVDEYGNAYVGLHLTATLCGVSTLDVVNFFEGDVDFSTGVSPRELVMVLHYFSLTDNKTAINALAMLSSSGVEDFVYSGAGYNRGIYNSGYEPMMITDNIEYDIDDSVAGTVFRTFLVVVLGFLSGVLTGAVILTIIDEVLR